MAKLKNRPRQKPRICRLLIRSDVRFMVHFPYRVLKKVENFRVFSRSGRRIEVSVASRRGLLRSTKLYRGLEMLWHARK